MVPNAVRGKKARWQGAHHPEMGLMKVGKKRESTRAPFAGSTQEGLPGEGSRSKLGKGEKGGTE